eukprot:GGOE01041677.1.p1 GENE.GGOE01041677.1~~GGOE01041677.1.p1  ORF type:complete len:233 (-),score=68.17 GGOE01041677.1:273-947(-)
MPDTAAVTPVLVVVVLFPGYEPLDVVGPINVFANVPGITIRYAAAEAGPIAASKGALEVIASHTLQAVLDSEPPAGLLWLLVPGGLGTRTLVHDAPWIRTLAALSSKASLTMSVCTGAGLLAAAGVLDGKAATSNKMAFEWVRAQGPGVGWQPKARWVDAGDVITSAGVAAGIDMALYVVRRFRGTDVADSVAQQLEYEAHLDEHWDPFANKYTWTAADPEDGR